MQLLLLWLLTYFGECAVLCLYAAAVVAVLFCDAVVAVAGTICAFLLFADVILC